MTETYCGKSCAECEMSEQLNCQGCKYGPGRRFNGDCELAKCVMEKGHETCQTCSFMGTCAKQRSCTKMPEDRLRRLEAEAARKAEMAKQAPLLGKWLWIIFWLIIPSSVASILTNQTLVQYIPSLNLPGQIMTAVCSALYGIFLLKLASTDDRYKKAGMFILIAGGVSAVDAIVTGAVGAVQAPAWTLLLTIPAAIIALIGEYNEYMGHSAVLDGVDNELSEKWATLWKWYIGMFLGMFGCILVMLIIPILGVLALLCATIGLVVIGIKKLVYLYRTAKIFKDYSLMASPVEIIQNIEN